MPWVKGVGGRGTGEDWVSGGTRQSIWMCCKVVSPKRIHLMNSCYPNKLNLKAALALLFLPWLFGEGALLTEWSCLGSRWADPRAEGGHERLPG